MSDPIRRLRLIVGYAVTAVFLAAVIYSAIPRVTWRPDVGLELGFGAIIAWLFAKPITDRRRKEGDDDDA